MMSNDQAMGNNLAIMWPGETSKPYKGLPAGRPIRPRWRTSTMPASACPSSTRSGASTRPGARRCSYGRKTVNGRVIGTRCDYGDARKHFPRPAAASSTRTTRSEKRRVVFLGDEMAKDIFGPEDPLGKTVLINNSPFTVIGVMQSKTQSRRTAGRTRTTP